MSAPINSTAQSSWTSFQRFVENADPASSEIRGLLVLPIFGELTQLIQESQFDARIRSAANPQEKLFWQTKKMSLLRLSFKAAALQAMMQDYLPSENVPAHVNLLISALAKRRMMDCAIKIQALRTQMPILREILIIIARNDDNVR